MLAQDVFPKAHTLIIVEPIWPMLQNVSKTLVYMYDFHTRFLLVLVIVPVPVIELLLGLAEGVVDDGWLPPLVFWEVLVELVLVEVDRDDVGVAEDVDDDMQYGSVESENIRRYTH